MAKKYGARITDQNKIRRLAKEGLTAEEISDNLQIAVGVVRSFLKVEDEPEEPELTEDQKTEISELADDNDAEEIAETLDIELSLVEAFLAED